MISVFSQNDIDHYKGEVRKGRKKKREGRGKKEEAMQQTQSQNYTQRTRSFKILRYLLL